MANPSPFDRTKAAALFVRYADTLGARLVRRYRGVDPDLVSSAAVDAIMSAATDPDFPTPDDPDCAIRLARMARDRLRSTLRSEARRRLRETKYQNDVTSGRSDGPEPHERLEDRELADDLRRRIAPNHLEAAALDLMLSGVSNPADLAARLNIDLRPARILSDRLRQRICRERRRREENP